MMNYASSGDLSSDAALLERAIRCNDTIRVKRFLNLHHEKFPVNLHGSLLDKSSSDDSASQDVEILLRKSKTLIDKLEPTDQYSSSSSSCRSPPASPLIFSNALHVAVDHGAVEVARLLLKYGLEPDQGGRVPPAPPSPRRPQPPSRPCSPQPHTRTPSPKKRETDTSASKEIVHPSRELSPQRYLKPTLPPSTPTSTLPVRRVSWIAPTSPPDMSKKRRATTKSLPRQRSFSLEHNNQLLGPGGSWNTERRSVSLKSSPLISPRPPDAGSSPAKVKAIVPERSIFAELRRSSEIFKSILLNLSMKDAEQQALEDEEEKKTPTENQVDVETLLAAHEQRKLATYQTESGFSSTSSSSLTSPSRSSRSSLSSPDEEDDGDEVLGIGSPTIIGPKEGPLLKLNPNIEPDKVTGMMDTYTRQYLFTLPALFLAVIRGNATLVYLLLKYGASVNFQDRLGNTALHLAVCQENVPWECVLDLLEHGARIAMPNKAGVTPADLCAPHLLVRLQHHMLQDCWQGLGDKKEPITSSIVSGGSISMSNANRMSNNPSRILRKLRTARAESVEEATSCASGDQQLSSTGSIRSHGSTKSPDLVAQAIIAKERQERQKEAKEPSNPEFHLFAIQNTCS